LNERWALVSGHHSKSNLYLEGFRISILPSFWQWHKIPLEVNGRYRYRYRGMHHYLTPNLGSDDGGCVPRSKHTINLNYVFADIAAFSSIMGNTTSKISAQDKSVVKILTAEHC
jgi:hypothetical protein